MGSNTYINNNIRKLLKKLTMTIPAKNFNNIEEEIIFLKKKMQ